MSHINAENALASQIKSVATAGTAKMMDSTIGNMGMVPMMDGMGSMMKGRSVLITSSHMPDRNKSWKLSASCRDWAIKSA